MTFLDPGVVRDFAEEITPSPQKRLVRRNAVIQAISAGPPATVSLTIGSLIIPNVRYLNSYWPTVGDVVFVDFNGPDPLVIGAAARATVGRSGEIVTVLSYQAMSAGGNTGSNTYVDYPGPVDITFVKKYSAAISKLVVFGTVSAFQSGANGIVSIGLRSGGVDHTIGTFNINQTFVHMPVTCQDDTFSLAAGSLSLRVRWSTSVPNVNTDTNDSIRLTLLEVII